MGKDKNKLETWGNETTMNLNPIVHQNVQASLYFKSLYEKKTFHEVLQEVKNHVSNLEPFLKGRTASTAFCLLYKFWTMRLTVKQLMNLVECKDNTFVRALGFLYLRFVCKPADLWEWFEPYLDDEELVVTTGGARKNTVTIGNLCRRLLMDQKFMNTMLPRIPVPVARDIEQNLKAYDAEANASRAVASHPAYDRRSSPDYGEFPRPRPVPGSPAHITDRTVRRSRTPNAEVDDFGRVRRRSRSPESRSQRDDRSGGDGDRRRDRDRHSSDRRERDGRDREKRDSSYRDYERDYERSRDRDHRRRDEHADRDRYGRHHDDRHYDDRHHDDRHRDERHRSGRRGSGEYRRSSHRHSDRARERSADGGHANERSREVSTPKHDGEQEKGEIVMEEGETPAGSR